MTLYDMLWLHITVSVLKNWHQSTITHLIKRSYLVIRSPFLDQSRLLRLLNSPLVIWFSQLPPIQWLTDILVLVTTRRLKRKQLNPTPVSRLESTLNTIVHDVVTNFGYVGAIVATREPDDSLPVRAYFVDPQVISKEEIEKWERRISLVTGRKVGLKSPVSRAYLNDKRFKDNLSVRAITAEGGPRVVTHHELYSLFTPVVPKFLRGVIKSIQNDLGIRQVIAVPFFLEGESKDRASVVGNLFVAAKNEISLREEQILHAFGRQAAVAIENERRLQQEYRLHGQVKALQSTILKMQTSLKDEQEILDNIVEGVVINLGYVGAMVATRVDNTLPVKAYFVDPNIITEEEVKKWEYRLSLPVGQEIGLKAPIACTYLLDERFQNNLSFRAIMAEGGPRIEYDKELFSLFVPVVPEAFRRVIWRVQKFFEIGHVIAVPFYLEENSKSAGQVIGNLFVITREDSFSQEEIEILQTFAQQAAIGIRNAQLYHQVQSLEADIAQAYREERDRRVSSEKIAQMATLITNIRHDLRGELSKLQVYAGRALKVNNKVPLPPSVIEDLNKIVHNATVALDLVQRLKQPTQPVEFKERNIREHITEAIATAKRLSDMPKIEVIRKLPNEDIYVQSTDDLTEVFSVLLNNAADAMGGYGKITILGQVINDKWVVISINDTGPGVPDEIREQIFEESFTTKASGGLGYGLFYARTALTWMNGNIWLAERNGSTSGATFLVRLPTVSPG